ncbi:MAG TPA: magnesium/cobalt transporter CorA [Salinimicrobium sp.]|nr:magnesium/cobalt transporter CorA [Salinimicrobium sp.]
MSKRKKFSLKRPKPYNTLHQVPGTVTYVGHKESSETNLEVIDYNKDCFEHITTKIAEDVFKYEDENKITWININGLSQISEIEKIGKYYELHPLIREDIVNTDQRPKIDEYEDYYFLVTKMLYHNENGQLVIEPLSIVLGKGYVLTFQEAEGDVFGELRDRIANNKGRIRNKKADYLMFSILDAVIDAYFVVIEGISNKIEDLEEKLFNAKPREDVSYEIQELKREILRIRRAVIPLREVVSRLEKIDSDLIDPKTKNYLSDLYDHILQVSDNIEVYREMTWGLMDLYMTTISNKMNEVMKVLTIMASIFIPLTFIAGIYGMNFEYMPELEWHYSYFVLWGVMIIIFLLMLYYFKRKGWM